MNREKCRFKQTDQSIIHTLKITLSHVRGTCQCSLRIAEDRSNPELSIFEPELIFPQDRFARQTLARILVNV